jgi:hypothetical protein
MENRVSKLLLVKTTHTVIWVFFNLVMLYLFYAVITGRINFWVCICIGLFAFEGIILLLFKYVPINDYRQEVFRIKKGNFDIFLPNWLARNNKLIYSILPGICILMLAHRQF